MQFKTPNFQLDKLVYNAKKLCLKLLPQLSL